MTRESLREADALRRGMQLIFRRFGALAGDRTPCGRPLPLSHAHALMVLRTRGELSQRALGDELGIDKSNVARLCARMEDMGHVQQRACEDDGRSRRIDLTAKGRKVADDVDEASSARFRELLRCLPPARRPHVIEALDDLGRAIERAWPVLLVTLLFGGATACRETPALATPDAGAVPAPTVATAAPLPLSGDVRTPVPLLPVMALHQKENMRDHLLAVQEITAALAKEDFGSVERAASRIGFSPAMGQMCTHMGAGAPGFTEKALEFHHAADKIGVAAKAKDRSAVLAELAITLDKCTSCHATWRQEVVDQATYSRLTGGAGAPRH